MTLPSAPAQPTVDLAPATVPGRGLAIAAFVLAFVVPPVGAILGIVALVKLRKNGGKQGLAIAAIVLGALFTIGWIIFAVAMTAVLAGAVGLVAACAELGPGVWDIDGTTITCE